MSLSGRPSARRVKPGDYLPIELCGGCDSLLCPCCGDHLVVDPERLSRWICGCGWSGLLIGEDGSEWVPTAEVLH